MKMLNNIKVWGDSCNRYKVRLKELMDNRDIKTFTRDLISSLRTNILSLTQKIKHLRQTNYELGMMHYNNGNLQDAILRFNMLLRFCKTQMPELHYFLGRCYIERNQSSKAIAALEKYLASEHTLFAPEAEYCLKLAQREEDGVTQIPLSIIARIFDLLAPEYDDIFLKAPDLPQDEMYRMIVSHFVEVGHPYGNRILDLGCGSGYIAKMLKNSKIAFAIEGVDISTNMIKLCKEIKVEGIPCYDNLVNTDVDTFLQGEHSGKFDVVIASYLLGFYNNTTSFCKKISEAIKRQGILIISFKTTTTDKDVTFDTFLEEFSFNASILEQKFKENGLSIKHSKEISFPDKDPGLLWLLIRE